MLFSTCSGASAPSRGLADKVLRQNPGEGNFCHRHVALLRDGLDFVANLEVQRVAEPTVEPDIGLRLVPDASHPSTSPWLMG